jgi:hypothetical protein
MACAAFLCLVITGCAATQPANTLGTPTGKADVIIANASKAEIADKITNAMLSSDFQLEGRDQDNNTLVFMKRHSERWWFRFTYNIVNHPPEGVRVMATIIRIMDPGKRDQVVTDISRGSRESESVYALLTQIRESFRQPKTATGHPRKGLGMTMKNYTITSVAQGGAAEKAGIEEGDVILKIDGQPTTGDEIQDAARITGNPGATVELLIRRNDQERVIPLER